MIDMFRKINDKMRISPGNWNLLKKKDSRIFKIHNMKLWNMLITADWTLNELENRNYPDKVQGKWMKNTENYIKYIGCSKRSNVQISRISEESERVGHN